MSMNSDLYNKKKGDRLTIDIDVLSDSNLQTEKKRNVSGVVPRSWHTRGITVANRR